MEQAHKKRPPCATANSPPVLPDMGKIYFINLEDKEKAFVESPFSHVDFLLYNSLTKQPISAIEVDGWHFHKENDAQQSRDALKNQIFTKLGLHLLRISTADTVNQETIKKSLLAIL